MTTEEMLDGVIDRVKQTMLDDGYISPFCLILTEKEEIAMLPCIYEGQEEKWAFFMSLREKLLPELKAKGVIFVSEAWMRETSNLTEDCYRPVADCDDRKEILTVSYSSATEKKFQAFDIIRQGHKVVNLRERSMNGLAGYEDNLIAPYFENPHGDDTIH